MILILYQYYWLILRLPSIEAKNRIRSTGLEDLFKHIVLAGFALGVAWAEYAFFLRFWAVLGNVPLGYALLMPRFFSLFGSFLVVFLFYSSFLTALSSLYRSDDLDFLLSMPVPVSLILFFKWIDVAIRSGGTLLFFSLPPAIALGKTLSLPLSFYGGYLLSALAFFAIGISAGTILAMGFMAFCPVKRMHQTAAIVGLCIAALAITGLRFLHLETLWSDRAATNPLILFLQQEPTWIARLAPGQYFSSALISSLIPANSHWEFWRLLGVGFLSVMIAIFGGRTLFLRGWWRSREQGDPIVLSSVRMASVCKTERNSSRFKTLIWKDWLILKRDPSIWTQLFMMVPLAALYLLNLSFIPLRSQELIPFYAIADLGLIGLIVAAIGARFLFPSASREGRAVWIPSVAPITGRKVILQKTLFHVPPVMGLAFFLLAGSATILKLPGEWSIWILFYGLFLSLLICLLSIFLGFCFPSYSHRHLLEVSLGKGAFLFMLLALILIVSLEYIAFQNAIWNPKSRLSLFQIDLILWAVAWSGAARVFYRMGERRWGLLSDRTN